MKVVPPVTIVPSMFNSNVPEPSPGEQIWVSGTSYAQDAEVILTSIHKKYRRITAGGGTTPPNLAPETWYPIGASNKYAMLDLYRNKGTTQAVATASIFTFDISPGVRVNTIGFFGCKATSIHVVAMVAGQVVYDKTFNMMTRNTVSWSSYYFGGFTHLPSLLLAELPPLSNMTIYVTAINGVDPIVIGSVVVGTYIEIGVVQYQARIEDLNFSVINRDDEFGDITLQPRDSIPKTTQTLIIKRDQVNSVRAAKKLLNAIPAVYAALDDNEDPYFESLLILGIYREWTISLDTFFEAVVNLELEEL